MCESDRRQTSRHQSTQEVLVKVLHSEQGGPVDGRIYACTAADISATGLRLRSSVSIAINDQLDLRIRAEEKRFVLAGRACWVVKDGDFISGIRFEEAEGDDTESWNTWVDSL